MSEQPKPKILTRLRIDEVSLVDRGAGKNCKILISKRDDSADDNAPHDMPTWEKRYWEALGPAALRHAIDRRAEQDSAEPEPENPYLKYFRGMKVSESAGRAMLKVAAELNKGNDADDDDDGLKRDGREAIADIVEDVLDQDDDGKPAADGATNDHPAQRAADILVEAGKFSNRAEALDYLLHNPRGAAMLRRLHKSEDQPTMTDYKTKLYDLAKRAGPIAIAKTIVDDDNAYGISEHDMTALVTECAKRDHPGLSDAQAFVKVFTDQSEAGTILRRAFNVIKAAAPADGTTYPFPKF